MITPLDVVRRFRELQVLVIGDAMLDSYLEGHASRLCTEGPVPVVRKTAEQRAPGGAANSAANLRALGAEVFLVGLTGPDVPGIWLRAALKERGIDDRWLIEDPEAGTLHKLRILADGQYVVRFDEGDTKRCSPEGHQKLLAALDELFPRCDLIVISDYCYGVLSNELINRLRLLRSDRPCVLVVDSKDLRRFRHAGATVVTPNLLEARLAVGQGREALVAPQDGSLRIMEVERIGRRLLAKIDAEYAAVTLAADGVCLVNRQGPALHLPAHPVAHANDVGAGDSFTAAMALALAAGATPEDAVQIGIDAAAIAVDKRRTAAVQHQELLQRVSLRALAAHAWADGRRVDGADLLAAQLAVARTAPDGSPLKVVFTNGVFDILHAGHVEFLRQARLLGDLLVVGVNSDRSARKIKGPQRPINSERDRLALVAALDTVDYAILFDEETPDALIRALRPNVHVKGGDYAGESLPESEAVRDVGGEVVIIPLVGDLSTTQVIDRIVAGYGTQVKGATGPNSVQSVGAGDD